jgi:hypothetical protein
MNKIYILLFFFSFISSSALLASCLKAPASFDDNRIYLKVKGSKETLLFYTDSGGGIYPFVYRPTVEKLKMKIEKTVHEEGMEIGFSTFSSDFKDQNIPTLPEWKGNVRVFTAKPNGNDELSQIKFFIHDGFFGATFFAAGKIWRFDYSAQELWYCNSLPETEGFASMNIYFKEKKGVRDTHQPRMEMEVSGKKLPMLFDTGATSFYSPEAVKQLKLNKQINPTSFIRESVARNWQKNNPTWKVINSGDKFGGGGFLIEVPKLKVVGMEVGPVWFATRKDTIYDKYSEDIMDSHIDGAVGGNVFKHFEIIADYPAGKLYFKQVMKE